MDKIPLFLEAFANTPYIYALLIANLILRGLALYKSARKEHKIWFISLLILNTAGILPIVYLILQNIAASKVKTIPVSKNKPKIKK